MMLNRLIIRQGLPDTGFMRADTNLQRHYDVLSNVRGVQLSLRPRFLTNNKHSCYSATSPLTLHLSPPLPRWLCIATHPTNIALSQLLPHKSAANLLETPANYLGINVRCCYNLKRIYICFFPLKLRVSLL